MRRRAALAAAGAVALLLGFGITWFGGQDRTLAGHRESSQTLAAAYVSSTRDDAALSAHHVETQRLETERLETERLTREREEAEAEAKAEDDRRIAREAAVRAEAVRKAAAAISTPTTVRAAPVARTPAVESSGSGACGGSLPPCSVMRSESGGNPRAVNRTGCGGRGCFGKWQFDPRTSAGLGYDLTMDQYPESVQDDAARSLWNSGRGCSHWDAC